MLYPWRIELQKNKSWRLIYSWSSILINNLNKAIENLLINFADDTKLDKLVNDSESEKRDFKWIWQIVNEYFF